MKKLLLVVLVLVLSLSSSFAEKEFSFSDLEYNYFFEDAPNPIDVVAFEKFSNNDNINFVYLGASNSIDMWLSVGSNGMEVLSTTLDGKSLIVGPVYDREGKNIISTNINKLIPGLGEAIYIYSQKNVRDNIDAEILAFQQINEVRQAAIDRKEDDVNADLTSLMWKALGDSNYIELGDPDAPIIYMFSDIFCGHCSSLLTDLRPYIKSKNIRLRYIPIGILSNESIIGALGILSSADPKLAWHEYYDNHNALVLKTEATDKGIKNLETNLMLFDNLGLKGTPSLFYKTRGGEVKFLYGKPSSIEDFINDISK